MNTDTASSSVATSPDSSNLVLTHSGEELAPPSHANLPEPDYQRNSLSSIHSQTNNQSSNQHQQHNRLSVHQAHRVREDDYSLCVVTINI